MSIVLDKIGKTLGTRVLFDDVSVVFNPGNRYGLTGLMELGNPLY